MTNEWFNEMLKQQSELAKIYQEQKRLRKLEKNRAEKLRVKENLAKIKSPIIINDFKEREGEVYSAL